MSFADVKKDFARREKATDGSILYLRNRALL